MPENPQRVILAENQATSLIRRSTRFAACETGSSVNTLDISGLDFEFKGRNGSHYPGRFGAARVNPTAQAPPEEGSVYPVPSAVCIMSAARMETHRFAVPRRESMAETSMRRLPNLAVGDDPMNERAGKSDRPAVH